MQHAAGLTAACRRWYPKLHAGRRRMANANQDEGPRPIIALAIGDPAGIGPELAAKLTAEPEVRAAAQLIVVGDKRVLERGAAEMGVSLDLETRPLEDATAPASRPVLVDLGHLDPATIERSVASAAGGRFALENFNT